LLYKEGALHTKEQSFEKKKKKSSTGIGGNLMSSAALLKMILN
jgi:hypothetical protein